MPTAAMVVKEGKSYVNVGFVDNSVILFSHVVIKDESKAFKPVKFYNIDMNPICVARSIIIYEMMKQKVPTEAILEVWYLSCLSKITNEIFRSTLESLVKSKSF